MPVVVVTDSSCCLPPEIATRFRIRQVPLHIVCDGVDYRETVDEIPAEVLATPGVTTSGATPADLEKTFAKALKDSKGDGVVAVHMSRKLSSTWSAARVVADQYDGAIRVVDSRSVGLAVGFTALVAAQASARGGDRDAVYESAVREAATIESMICVSDLDHLRSSGRISAASRMLGSALSIKPILHTVDGSLTLRERHRTFSKAVAKMIDAACEIAGARPVSVGVQHSDAPEAAEQVMAELQSRIPDVVTSMTTPLGPVLSVHVGTGAVGVTIGSTLTPLD
ncbi:DegV family protein [Gordonia crocea]|uniref:DegV domain-containing protein n=1 Tax=Gordonia crocea TaxID=589162 RepID=A0A7I9V031_9ACTN|nr:DegV family protein [Gordonia crocea]GED98430.1 DegV domain-containing protein [Gordonia crocea]